jgi:hypothetical protein
LGPIFNFCQCVQHIAMSYEEYLLCDEGDDWDSLSEAFFGGDYSPEELYGFFGIKKVKRFLKRIKPRKTPPRYNMALRESKRLESCRKNRSRVTDVKYQKWSNEQLLLLQSYYAVCAYISNRDNDKTRLGSLLAELSQHSIKGVKVSKTRVLRWFKYQRNKSDSTHANQFEN